MNGIFWILIFCLSLFSCASQPAPEPVPVDLGAPTPTPFQPQSGISDAPYNSPALSQIEPTFTPYPTSYLPAAILSTPVENISAPGDAVSMVTNPLTGLPAANPALLNRRPMAIKISNFTRSIRPQFGMTLADVIYEYYTEWHETRFIAVFYSNDSQQVGPVRSGRFFDEHITRMYHAYYVFNGADGRELTYFMNSDIADFLVTSGPSAGACSLFFIYRVAPDISDAEHFMHYFDTIKFNACLARKGWDNTKQSIRSGFFSDTPAAGALAVHRIYTRYSPASYNYWEYDAVTRKYFRYEDTQDVVNNKTEAYAPLSDAETGLPVTADNVVALFVPHIFANQFDQADEVYHIDLVDSGEAYVFRDGAAFPARWSRPEMDQPILLTSLNGTPIFLRPGRTFYQVLGETSTYTQDGTDWRFTFKTP